MAIKNDLEHLTTDLQLSHAQSYKQQEKGLGQLESAVQRAKLRVVKRMVAKHRVVKHKIEEHRIEEHMIEEYMKEKLRIYPTVEGREKDTGSREG